MLDLSSVPVRDGRAMGLWNVDDVPVESFPRVFLSPGWHSFRYGYRKAEGCRKYKHTQAYIDFGVAVQRDPLRDKAVCLEPVIREHSRSGWFLMEGGRRYRWTEIQPLLKEKPDP